MKDFDTDKLLEQAIVDYLKFSVPYTGRDKISDADKFALFMNLVRSSKYSDATLRELYYKIIEL